MFARSIPLSIRLSTVYAAVLLSVSAAAFWPDRAVADAALTPSPPSQRAPAFDMIDTEGRRHRLEDYLGKVFVVNFWATWCPPCIKEMPALQRAWESLKKDDIAVLGINMGESKEDIDAFTLVNPVEFPLLLDEDMQQGPAWSLKGLPTTYIVGADGDVVYAVVGEREWDDPALLDEIRALRP